MAQDLSSFALDRSGGRTESRPDGPAIGARRPIVDLVAAVAERVRWTRLLYLYPSTLDDALVDAILATGVPYFDLSLQHVSRPLLKRMRRWGEGDRFLERIGSIRRAEPTAAFRSSFIIGYPGETEADHDHLLAVDRRGPARLGGVLPLQQRGRHLRLRARRPGARRTDGRAAA